MIYKHGYRYRFNAPKVVKRKQQQQQPEPVSDTTAAAAGSASSYRSATSRTSDDDDDDDCSDDDSRSYTTSYSRSTRSTKRSVPREPVVPVEEKAKEVVVEEAENVDGVKSSGEELSSSVAPSVSSLSASRGSSRRRRRRR